MSKLVVGLVVLVVAALTFAGWEARSVAGWRGKAEVADSIASAKSVLAVQAVAERDAALDSVQVATGAVKLAEQARQVALAQRHAASSRPLPPLPPDSAITDTTARRQVHERDSAQTARIASADDVIREDANVIAKLAADTLAMRRAILAGVRLDSTRVVQISALTTARDAWKRAATVGKWFGVIPIPRVTAGYSGIVDLQTGRIAHGPGVSIGWVLAF